MDGVFSIPYYSVLCILFSGFGNRGIGRVIVGRRRRRRRGWERGLLVSFIRLSLEICFIGGGGGGGGGGVWACCFVRVVSKWVGWCYWGMVVLGMVTR